jgi:hypothetical protein
MNRFRRFGKNRVVLKASDGKTWDSGLLKFLAILISVIALVISSFSWWESHRSRLVNEEINRPILSLTSVEIESDVYSLSAENYVARVYLFFTARVKNLGKSTAVVSKSEVKPEFFDSSKRCRIIKNYDEEAPSNGGEPILSGGEATYTGAIALSLPCEEKPSWDFGLDIKLEYVDAGSGKAYSQQFDKIVKVSPIEERTKREAKQKED